MFITSELMTEHGVKAVFSDRQGGYSQIPFDSLNLGLGLGDSNADVEQNLQLLCEQSQIKKPHQSKQVHGIKVLHCSGDGLMHEQEADILLTAEFDVPLAVRTADCLPVLLADPESHVIAAVHAGWRGTAAQVVKVAVQEMCLMGANTETIVASLGPCIGPCCFEIDADIARKLEAACDEKIAFLSGGNIYADLSKANIIQLLDVGLLRNNIEHSSSCTACQSSPGYFSYRRDKGETGRQLSIVVLS